MTTESEQPFDEEDFVLDDSASPDPSGLEAEETADLDAFDLDDDSEFALDLGELDGDDFDFVLEDGEEFPADADAPAVSGDSAPGWASLEENELLGEETEALELEDDAGLLEPTDDPLLGELDDLDDETFAIEPEPQFAPSTSEATSETDEGSFVLEDGADEFADQVADESDEAETREFGVPSRAQEVELGLADDGQEIDTDDAADDQEIEIGFADDGDFQDFAEDLEDDSEESAEQVDEPVTAEGDEFEALFDGGEGQPISAIDHDDELSKELFEAPPQFSETSGFEGSEEGGLSEGARVAAINDFDLGAVAANGDLEDDLFDEDTSDPFDLDGVEIEDLTDDEDDEQLDREFDAITDGPVESLADDEIELELDEAFVLESAQEAAVDSEPGDDDWILDEEDSVSGLAETDFAETNLVNDDEIESASDEDIEVGVFGGGRAEEAMRLNDVQPTEAADPSEEKSTAEVLEELSLASGPQIDDSETGSGWEQIDLAIGEELQQQAEELPEAEEFDDSAWAEDGGEVVVFADEGEEIDELALDVEGDDFAEDGDEEELDPIYGEEDGEQYEADVDVDEEFVEDEDGIVVPFVDPSEVTTHVVGGGQGRILSWRSFAAAAVLFIATGLGGVVVLKPEWLGVGPDGILMDVTEVKRPRLALRPDEPVLPPEPVRPADPNVAVADPISETPTQPEQPEQPVTSELPAQPEQPVEPSQPEVTTPPVDVEVPPATGPAIAVAPTETEVVDPTPPVAIESTPVKPVEAPVAALRTIRIGDSLEVNEIGRTLPSVVARVAVGQRALARLENAAVFVGEVKQLGQNLVTLDLEGGEVSLVREELEVLVPFELANSEGPTYEAGEVRLRNEQRLVGRVVRPNGKDFVAVESDQGRILVPLTAIETVRARTPGDSTPNVKKDRDAPARAPWIVNSGRER